MKRISDEGRPVLADGIHRNLSMWSYHEDPAISKSGLADLADSPLHYVSRRQFPEIKKKHFDIGETAHAMILQPDQIDKIVAVPPAEVLAKNGARSGNKYKEWSAEQGRRTIVTQKEYDQCREIADSVLLNPEHTDARLLLTSGISEVSFFLTDPNREIRIKVRPDHIPGADIISDLKTTRSAAIENFGVDSFRLKYHWSAYLTCQVVSEVTGQEYHDYRFVAVETAPPYDVCIYRPDHTQIQTAREEVEHYLDVYADCYHQKEWPGYPAETQSLYWPAWAWKQTQVNDEFAIYE